MRSDSWSFEEDAILRNIYADNSKKFILSKIPKRSWQSIRIRARFLNLTRCSAIIKQEMIEGGKTATRDDFWSKNENDILKTFYCHSLQETIENKLPGRNFKSIREKALRLGLSREKKIIDQDREIKNKTTLIKKYGVDCSLKIPEVEIKSRQTNMEKRGFPYPTQSIEIRKKIKKTVQKRYGVDNVFQADVIKNKSKQSLYKHGSQRCSKQQFYIATLLKGKINYPIGHCNVDILLNDNIVCEYDGGGHSLTIKLNRISEENFDNGERKRELFLKSKGFLIIRIVSRNDMLPKDEILIKMIAEAEDYLKKGHSWITFDIDKKEISCSEYKTFYDFEKLRKIY
jgi:very-short-patch-repair endonuclease